MDPMLEGGRLLDGGLPPLPPRTEAQGESASLTIIVGGKPVDLPALRIRQSREWQKWLSGRVLQIDIPESNAEGVLAATLGQDLDFRIEALNRYDVSGVLGGQEGIEDRMTGPEVTDAVRHIFQVEFPFGEGSRSVEWAVGLPLRVMARLLEVDPSQLANSRSGASPTGASPTSGSSTSGPRSNSSSGGSTRRTGKRGSSASAS